MTVSFFLKTQGDMTPKDKKNQELCNVPDIVTRSIKAGFGVSYSPLKSDFSVSVAFYGQNNQNYDSTKNSYTSSINNQIEMDGYYKPKALTINRNALTANTVFQERVRVNLEKMDDGSENNSVVSRTYVMEEISHPFSDKFSVTGYFGTYLEGKIPFQKDKEGSVSFAPEVGASLKYSINEKHSIQLGVDWRDNSPEASLKYNVKI